MDVRTGSPSLLWGSGQAWGVVGAGSTPDTLETAARAFLARYPGIFGVSPADLVLNPVRSGVALEGAFAVADFDFAPGGVSVEGARVFFRVNHGRLIQAGSRHVPRGPVPPAAPSIGPGEALESVAKRLRVSAKDLQMVREWDRVWLPEDRQGDLALRLSWAAALRRPGELATWEARVDAFTGEVLHLWDRNQYACVPETLGQGRVDGGVPLLEYSDPDTVVPMPWATVTVDGVESFADFNGLFPYTTGTVATGLNGRYADVNCSGCVNPPQVFAESATTGDLHLGSGGGDLGTGPTGNGFSHRAERTTFYHLGLMRSLAAKWIPGNAWLNAAVPAQVGIPATCNAFWDGVGVNFFRAGGGCNNTGEIPGVIQHEWGHGLDQNTGYGGDGARGEGFGDICSMLVNHSPIVGGWFFTGGGGVRNLDEDDPNNDVGGLLSTSNISGLCPPVGGGGGGPLGYEVHCEGMIYAQAHYHLTRKLVDKTGSAFAGWSLSEKLFFAAAGPSDTYVPDQSGSAYDAYLAVDDDNGDLMDGTPNIVEIYEAFNHHGIASTLAGVPITNSTSCAPVGAPTVTLTPRMDDTTGRAQVQVDWTAVAGASTWNILRSAAGPNAAYQMIASNIPAATTTYLDDQVVNGGDYTYVVQTVVDQGGGLLCVSTSDNNARVTIGLPEILLDSFASVDNPGNGNGVLMPGEGARISIVARNSGPVPATGTLATLTSRDPRAQVVQPLSTLGDLAPGGTNPPVPDPFQVTLSNDPALCGLSVVFDVTFTAGIGGAQSSCWSDAIALPVGGGRADVTFGSAQVDDFAAGNASGTFEPGESVTLQVTLANAGPGAATANIVTLTSPDPAVTIGGGGTSPAEDIAAGGTGSTTTGFPVTLSSSVPCGATIPFDLLVVSADGCWRDSFSLIASGPGTTEVDITLDDFEADLGWTADPGDATAGTWERGVPEATTGGGGVAGQPGQDHTPDPGTLCWVTAAPAGANAGANDVDGGCTLLTSPAYDLAASPTARVQYWRWYTNGTNPDDPFLVEISGDDGGSWSTLESVNGTTQPWVLADYSVGDALGTAPTAVTRFRFTACDRGDRSLTEALVDDFRIYGLQCDAPSPRPEVAAVSLVLDDTAPASQGNGNGFLDPGETVVVRVEARNPRNLRAARIAGTLALEAAPPGVTLTQAASTWGDLDPLAQAFNSGPEYILQVPGDAPCGATLQFRIDFAYESPTGTPYASSGLLTGRIGNGTTVRIFFDDNEGPGEAPWAHGFTANQDDWMKGAPGGNSNFDPPAAFSGSQIWGNDIGVPGSDGLYRNNTANWLETTVDCSGLTGVTLRFQRWLTAEAGQYDRADILVNGTRIWRNPLGEDLRDDLTGGWREVTHDLSALADQNPATTIRFALTSDPGLQFGGWNLDDVEVFGTDPLAACQPFGCPGPPAPVGDLLRVRLETGAVLLDWSAYSGDAGSFNVYRSVSPLEAAGGAAVARVYSRVMSTTQGDGDPRALPALVFYNVRGTDTCGQEEVAP